MKKLIALGIVVVLVVIAGFALLFGGFSYFFYEKEIRPCLDGQSPTTTGLDATNGLTGLPKGLTVKGQPMSAAQKRNAAVIYNEAAGTGQQTKAAVIGIITSIQEATLRNIPYGYPGSSSLGLFQQIAAWGPRDVRMNPAKSAHMFFYGGRQGQSGLTDIPGWELMEPGVAAQTVQRSAYPFAYTPHLNEAYAIVKALKGNTPSADSGIVVPATAPAQNCDQQSDDSLVNKFVENVVSYQGQTYRWDDTTGGGLLTAGATTAGFKFPSTLDGIATYKGDKAAGISVQQIRSPSSLQPASFARGSVVTWSTDDDAESERVGMVEGDPQEIGSFNIATYNVRGASHTDGKRTKELPSDIRMEKAVRVLKSNDLHVVGFQEFEGKQRKKFLAEADGLYGIYPKASTPHDRDRAPYRSIVWLKSRFDLVKGFTRPYLYFDGSRQRIPVVLLKDKVTGGRFYATNTHDPADTARFHNQGRFRTTDARIHKNYITRLARRMGLPVFLLGDFNSRPGSIQHRILTANGVLKNAYNSVKRRLGKKKERIDRIYGTSKDVRFSDWRMIDSREADDSSDHLPVMVTAAVGPRRPKPNAHSINVITRVKGKVGLTQVDTRKLTYAFHLRYTAPAGGAKGPWQWPIERKNWPAGSYTIAACDLLYSSNTVHTGIDMMVPGGTPVVASTDGKVVYTSGSYGMLTFKSANKTADGKDIYVNHQHLARSVVGEGKPIKAGQIIGYSGDTGSEGMFHLHYSTWKVSGPLSGHDPPGSPEGRNTLSQMYHPMSFLPDDGRVVHDCKKPYRVPGQ